MSLMTSVEEDKMTDRGDWLVGVEPGSELGSPSVSPVSIYERLLAHCQRHDCFCTVVEELPGDPSALGVESALLKSK